MNLLGGKKPLTIFLYLIIVLLLSPVLLGTAPVNAAVIIQYHHISEETPATTSISPDLFAEHIQHLADAGYQVIPLPELVAHLREGLLHEGDALPDKVVAITFDDGYRSVYDTAFPILKRKGWPFTVFVNTKPINQGLTSQFVSWQELREMAEAGATIANHSYSHPHLLRRLEGESDAQWRQRIDNELERAQRDIEENVGQRHRLFAYPYGEYDAELREILKQHNFTGFGQQSGPVGEHSDLLALPRFPFGGHYGAMDDFKIKVASLPMPIEHVRVTDADGDKLDDTVLPRGTERPRLIVELSVGKLAGRVQCFASGQGAIPVNVDGNNFIAQAPRDVPVGRSRYNCTAQSEEAGRFYWYSEFFIRKKPNGQWYEE